MSPASNEGQVRFHTDPARMGVGLEHKRMCAKLQHQQARYMLDFRDCSPATGVNFAPVLCPLLPDRQTGTSRHKDHELLTNKSDHVTDYR